MHFPVKPFPDEYVLGWRGRLKLLNHYPNIKTLEDDLRQKFSIKIKRNESFSSSGIPIIYFFAMAAGMDVSDFVRNHSLVPFFRAFDVKNFGSDEWSDSAITFLKYKSSNSPKKGAWFCSDCLKEDVGERGIPYWRRGHQLPAVDWCFKHKINLIGVRSNSAFDRPPCIKYSEANALADSNRSALTHLDGVIQRYVAIADHVLNRGSVTDFHLVTHILETKATELGLIDRDGGDWLLEGKIKMHLPREWLNGFKRGKYDFKVSSVFFKASNQRATELYLLLFSFLYESISDILLEFEKINHMTTLLPFGREEYSGEIFYSEYIRNNGRISDVAASYSFCHDKIEQYLKLYGLPALCYEKDSHVNALKDFFQGKSLMEVCEVHGVSSSAVEKLLRVSGARLALALNKMNI